MNVNYGLRGWAAFRKHYQETHRAPNQLCVILSVLPRHWAGEQGLEFAISRIDPSLNPLKFRVYRPVLPVLTGAVEKNVLRLPRPEFPAQATGHPPTPCSLPR